MGSMNSSLLGCRKKITFLLILINPMFSSPSSLTLPCFLSSLFPSFPPSFSCPSSCLLPSCSLFLPFSLSFLRSCYETPAGPQLTVPSLQSPEYWDHRPELLFLAELILLSYFIWKRCGRTAMGTLVLEGRQDRWLDQNVKTWSCGLDYGTDTFLLF